MTIAEFSGPEVHPIGLPLRQMSASAGTSLSDINLNTTNYSIMFIGQLWWTDRASHTVDTSGSSAIGWRCGSSTFANGGTTVKVGIAPVDTTNGPAGRASNTTNVIDFDVSVSYTGGGGGITANAWQESVPTSGTKTISHGQLIAVCIQMTAKAGADAILVRCLSTLTTSASPNVTIYNGSFSAQALMNNCVVRAADGTRGYLFGSSVVSAVSSTTYNTGTTTKECGNIIQVPYPCKAYGAALAPSPAASCDFDLILYEDPLGTPVSRASMSIDANTINASGFAVYEAMFTTGFGFSLLANTPYAIIAKPTSANNFSLFYRTFGNSAHQACIPGGANGYAINRNTGAFAAQNSSLDRFEIGLLVGGGDGGGGARFSAAIV